MSVRDGEFALYYVAIVKHDYICSLEAGPFINQELAEETKSKMEEPFGACRLEIVAQDITVRIA